MAVALTGLLPSLLLENTEKTHREIASKCVVNF